MGKLTKENSEEHLESYFIRCACHGHLLEISIFLDDIEVEDDPCFYLTLWGRDNRYSWINRVKAAWKILTTGMGGGNEMVLCPSEAKELGEKIVELSEKLKGKSGDTG